MPYRDFVPAGTHNLDELSLIRQSELRSSCLDEHFVFIRNSAFHASCLRLLIQPQPNPKCSIAGEQKRSKQKTY